MVSGKRLSKKYEGIPKPVRGSRGRIKIGDTVLKCRMNYPFGRRDKPRLSFIVK